MRLRNVKKFRQRFFGVCDLPDDAKLLLQQCVVVYLVNSIKCRANDKETRLKDLKQ